MRRCIIFPCRKLEGGGAPFIRNQEPMRSQYTLKTPIYKFSLVKSNKYIYNFGDKTTSDNMYM